MVTESFVIQSDIANLPIVEERLFHFCREYNVGRYYSAVSVATLQAVENAIVHGNRNVDDKCVTINFGTCRGGIFIEVADQGIGFDYHRYGNLPTSDDSRGEGIFIMRSLADRMTYSDGGRQVHLEFDVEGIDPAEALERITILQQHFTPVAA